jgi:hypothetical protein
MSLNLFQVREYIVRPALEHIGQGRPEAVQLVMATGAAESGFQFVDQVNRGEERPGPAYGPWQAEAATVHDIWRWLALRPSLARTVRERMILPHDTVRQLQGNFYYAAIMCRLHYMRFSEPLPEYGNSAGMARYWKKYYNTELGAGSVEGFLHKAEAVFNLRD